MKKQLMSFVSFSFAVLCAGCVTTGGNTSDNPLDPKNEITRERAGEIQENWWSQYKQSEHTETYEAHVKYTEASPSQTNFFVADFIGEKSEKEYVFTYKEGSYNASESNVPLEVIKSMYIGQINKFIPGGFNIAEEALRINDAKFYFDGVNFTSFTRRQVLDINNNLIRTVEDTVTMNSIGLVSYFDVKEISAQVENYVHQKTILATYKVVQ